MEEREMKKIHLFIVTLITCSLITLFVACEKDEEIDLTTISVSNEQCTPSYTSATLQCSFATKATLRNVYVQYATTQDFVEYDEMEMSKSDDVYSVVLDSLQDNTTYYVRYAVSNRYSSAITEEISTFQTLQPSVPTIALKSISDIWDTHAKAEIALDFDGGTPISEMGICWNTQTAPVLENNNQTTKDTIAALEIKDLQPNTQYFVRAYAINKVGVAYSEEYEFTTYSLPEIKTEDITDIQMTTALLNGTLVFNGNDTATIKGFCWSTNEEPTLDDDHIEIDTISVTYTYRLSNLIDETQYYVRAYAQNKIGIVYGETKSFTTMSALPPIVSINEVTDVNYHTATITADVISDGGADVTERGICYSTAENPTTESTKIISGKGTGSYTINLSNLQDSTTYYVRAYAINKKGIAYGEQKSFMTKGYMLPTITTANPTNVEYTSATVGGNISSDGGASVTECGICYSTTENPAIESNKIVSGKGTGSYTINLTDLQDSTTYYVRAYAINKKSTSYGEQKSFTTKAYAVPTVTTSSATNVSYTSATVGGNVTSDGGATVTECGVVYSTNQNPTTANSKVISGSGIGSFTCNITNLQENTKYYVRAYAINKKGTSYGEQSSFTTKAYILPTVTTSSATDISYTSATVGGNVTNDGGATVTERGVVYSTSQNPTTSNTKITSGTGTGLFTCDITNLQEGTIYYVRAYAINKKGTSYGEQKSFTTKAYAVPTVTTSSATNVSYTSATVGGNVTSDGGATVTECGVVYSTNQNPTTANSKVISGSGIGSFTCNITNLQENTKYYVRAYAINKKGTSYGEQSSFTTKAYILPTVTTSSATDISYTSATVGGNVTNDGGATVTERGVVYSTSQNPTTSNSKVICGSGEGDFSCTLTSLNSGTTYYVCAYAVNCKGTSYGNQIRFTTFTTHSYVDLGLSVKWATCNIGAETPEEYGEFFAWGEVEPKENYSWRTYKWYNTTSSTLTKYNTKSSYGIVDNKTQLDISDDAASANWGGDWRMPTAAEWEELRRECTWTWSNNGYKVTSDINGKSIFLPAAGVMNESAHGNQSEYGWYRSSSLDTYDPRNNNGMVFSVIVGYCGSGSSKRCAGGSVRPVRP